MEITDSCKKIIKSINECFEEIKKNQKKITEENMLLSQRVKTAEDTLLQFKETIQEELEKSYKTGYEAAIKEWPSENAEGGTKLVYTKNGS